MEDGVVVVEDAPLRESLLQAAVDLRTFPVPEQQLPSRRVLRGARPRLCPGRVVLGRHQLLLRLLDDVEDGADEVLGPQGVVESDGPQLGEDGVHDEPALRLVGDAEGGRDAESPAPAAHDALGEGVVIGQRRLTLEGSVDAFHPVVHLVGGLPRVGEDEKALRGGAGAHQPEEALDDDPGLARTGAGEDQARPLSVLDGSALGRVEQRRSTSARYPPVRTCVCRLCFRRQPDPGLVEWTP